LEGGEREERERERERERAQSILPLNDLFKTICLEIVIHSGL
jgi:hypothetical protein